MLQLENICVHFPSFVVENVNLEVNEYDYVALLGMSGAGKTIMLELLAGLVKPDSGRIRFRGTDITNKKIQARSIGLVYQDLALFPHMTVRKNIAYPLRHKGLTAKETVALVRHFANQSDVSHLLNRYPGTLSGGEAQRVALARTLAADPDILLLDEPLSNLDIKRKSELRTVLRNIHKSGKTLIHVTHDYMEIATLANKVAVMENGRLVQYDTPEKVFKHPKTEFVARFSGIKNLIPCKIKQKTDDPGLQAAEVSDRITIYYVGRQPECLDGYVMIPQEDIILSETPGQTSAVNNLKGVVTEAYLSGAGMELVVDAGIDLVVSVSSHSFNKMKLNPGKEVWLSFKASAVRFVAV